MKNHFKAANSEPNPHAVAALVRASESYTIVASEDIVDVRGMKLWAHGHTVSASLQQRLMEHRLQKPLESCLHADDGVTVFTLLEDLQSFIESSHPLAEVVDPWAQVLESQLQHIPLHPVVQLMLTAALASRPTAVPHAVMAMALAGAMMASRDASQHDIRVAMLAGLVHDIGEIYIHPQYLDYAEVLDLVGHKQLVAHPRVGQLLLTELTDYPALLSRAVVEHHERLDGSGYPARLTGDDMSTLGRLLAVVETTLGAMRTDPAPLIRASFALRVVPGEFDPQWLAFVCDAARKAREDVSSFSPPAPGADHLPSVAEQLADVEERLDQTRHLAQELSEHPHTPGIIDVMASALRRLNRLRMAWSSLGLCHSSAVDASPQGQFELAMAATELRQRLRACQRECLLLSDGLGETEKARLASLWEGLSDGQI